LAALVTLTLIGLGLTFPALRHLIERPFARIPQRQTITVTRGYKTATTAIAGAPTLHQIVGNDPGTPRTRISLTCKSARACKCSRSHSARHR
jgi:hypothetical protein